VLHLTDGDCAIEPLRAAGVEGEVLPWRENMLEGPVRRAPLGDLTAFAALDRLAPLHDEAGLTGRGRAVLAGDERWEATEERWVGGTRIPPGSPPWLWDAGTVRAAR
jgi:hypothetical protein